MEGKHAATKINGIEEIDKEGVGFDVSDTKNTTPNSNAGDSVEVEDALGDCRFGI